tara:strand:+ start:50 stop:775 length:726 start_codon:yes stop_codon:yes gene_type:complete
MAKRFTFTGLTNAEQDIQKATPLDFEVGPYHSSTASTTTPFAITVIEFPAPGTGNAIVDYGSVYTDKWSRTYESNDPLSDIEVQSVEDDGKTFIVSTPLERDMPVHLSASQEPAGLNPALTTITSGEGPFMSQTFFVKPLDGSGGLHVQLKTTPWNDTDGSGVELSAPGPTSYDSTVNFKLIPGHTNRIGVRDAQSIANITAGAFKTFLQDKYKISRVRKITATIELQGGPEFEYYDPSNP